MAERARRVVAVLGRGVVPAEAPLLRADDLGALRGDGVFETMHVRAGAPWLVEAHLARMARSAARLELPLPAAAALARLAAQACAAWPADVEGALRLVCTRGPETGGPPTTYALVSAVADAVRAARRAGLAVATASLGVAAAARGDAPWLLGGVKSLSYATNMATLRWAAGRGVDDVLWVSADGYALEGPTSTLVWADGGALCTVPAADTGVLPGCTARYLLDHAAGAGFAAAERMVRPAALAAADGVWLASSVRGLAEVRALDGAALPASRHTAALRDLLGFPAP
ncbi:4-amino-4-deoxychorismate lyase [Pilimelia terevasa]|uniref:4-amino-4-deoxychorismate lyase n=1 Tax=Pilimelia terevasa TaxID=53372 RepID=A0A8J3BS30_9ACTN|nr:aminotransferase class IV [Pilimelia terevasa]GGK29684.1 4-amino-4-deoxychorismate lyase [Pilimelia terevasa]